MLLEAIAIPSVEMAVTTPSVEMALMAVKAENEEAKQHQQQEVVVEAIVEVATAQQHKDAVQANVTRKW